LMGENKQLESPQRLHFSCETPQKLQIICPKIRM